VVGFDSEKTESFHWTRHLLPPEPEEELALFWEDLASIASIEMFWWLWM